MTVPPVPSFRLLALVGVVVLSLLLAVATVTVSRSVASARRDARQDEVRPTVRRAILERMSADDPQWDTWVADLDRTERAVAREELREYLQELRGRDRRAIQRLGRVLGVGRRARRRLTTGGRFERREALTWIVLLDVPVSVELLRETCGDHPETRAGAARVLAEREYPTAKRDGTELLLSDQTEPLSVLGLDTLYELNKHDPGLLFEYAARAYGRWSESLLIQVLRVVGEAGPTDPDTSLEWIGFLFAHESERVRAAAADALRGYGWHDGVRATIDVDRIRDDDSPRVRRAVYRMLGSWGDQRSRTALAESIRTETDARAALAGIEALANHGTPIDDVDLSAGNGAVRSWVEHRTTLADTADSR